MLHSSEALFGEGFGISILKLWGFKGVFGWGFRAGAGFWGLGFKGLGVWGLGFGV